MKQILFGVTMLVVLTTAACGNRNNTNGTDSDTRDPVNQYNAPTDTMGTDSIDSIIPPTPAPINPMM